MIVAVRLAVWPPRLRAVTVTRYRPAWRR